MAKLSDVAKTLRITTNRRLCTMVASKTKSGIRPYQAIPGPPVLPVIGTYYKYLPGGNGINAMKWFIPENIKVLDIKIYLAPNRISIFLMF